MKTLIDIHNHLLPGVDDGAGSLMETVEMLRAATKDGITGIIATPHYHRGRKISSYDDISRAFHMAKEEIERRNIPIQLFEGNEIFFSDNALEDLKQHKARSINGTQYVLVEFHPDHSFQQIKYGVGRVLEEGFFPIIAHVERYKPFEDDYLLLEELISMGGYIQINAADVMGEAGMKLKKLCRKMLHEELVHFVATDAHRAKGSRAPELGRCADFIEKKYGEDYAKLIFKDNPKKILVNESI